MPFYKKQFHKQTQVYYPQAVTVGKPVTTHQVAKRLAEISTVSEADAYAVLIGLRGVLGGFMAQGKSVEIEGLGNFRYGLDTVGVQDEALFDFQKQLKAVRVRFTPEKEGGTTRGTTATRALVGNDLEWLEWQGKTEADGTDVEEGTDEPGEDETENPLA